jgi:hypothetical protein
MKLHINEKKCRKHAHYLIKEKSLLPHKRDVTMMSSPARERRRKNAWLAHQHQASMFLFSRAFILLGLNG